MFDLLRFIPKNHLSFLVGKLVSIPLPYPLSYWTVSTFARAFKIDLSDVQKPIKSFRCIGDFFIRDLKPGVRPTGKGLLSPIDGTLRSHGVVRGGSIEQVKGKNYTVSELLGDESRAERFRDGYFFNLYLSPQDYHRVHSPVAGSITASSYIPGKLWPVNDWALNTIDKLLAVNERVVIYIEGSFGFAALVMVGATNVGKISVTFDSWSSNSLGRLLAPLKGVETREYASPKSIELAGELGTFHMGSSVVLLLENKLSTRAASQISLTYPRKVSVGQELWEALDNPV